MELNDLPIAYEFREFANILTSENNGFNDISIFSIQNYDMNDYLGLRSFSLFDNQ
jgi:hypothetical protein